MEKLERRAWPLVLPEVCMCEDYFLNVFQVVVSTVFRFVNTSRWKLKDIHPNSVFTDLWTNWSDTFIA